MIENVESMDDLKGKPQFREGISVLGFFGDYSEASRKAEPLFQDFGRRHPERAFYRVDTSKVKDLHAAFGVNSVPCIVRVRDGKAERRLFGQVGEGEYDSLLAEAVVAASPKPGDRPGVTVYTTPSCPWCVRVKAYLKEKKVPFKEVDVSLDEKRAEELVRRSGQKGVPQVQIGSSYVVGFDKPRIDGLLGLKG